MMFPMKGIRFYLPSVAMENCVKLIAETFGTGFLLFGGCIGELTFDDNPPSTYVAATAFGLVIMATVQCIGHISGGHINPAVTLASVVYRITSVPMGILYFIAQMVGAVLGHRLLIAVTPSKVLDDSKGHCGVCAVVPHEDMNEFTVFVIEYIATSVLVAMCCSFWDARNAKKQDSAPIKVGLTIILLLVLINPFSGGSLNPARTFAAAFWGQTYPMHWVYWIAPLLASLVTSTFYKFAFTVKLHIEIDPAESIKNDVLAKV